MDYYNSYVFVSGTTRLIDNDYLNSTSCCNYDTLFAILRNISRTDVYADSDLGGLTLNSKNYGGKELWDTTLSEKAVEFWDKNDVRHRYPGFTPAARVWLTVLVALPVAVIPVLGIVLHTRRKNR